MIRKEKYLAKRENKEPLFTCEVTPHHLFLSTKDWERLGGVFGKMNPPLRGSHSIKALVNGLNDGTIDMVASDHAPHLESEKGPDIRAAPSGVPGGVETLMPLMLAAVRKNILPLAKMIMLTSWNPARAFGLDLLGKGKLEVGYNADLMIVDPRNLQPVRADMLHSKAGWTPPSKAWMRFFRNILCREARLSGWKNPLMQNPEEVNSLRQRKKVRRR